MSPWYSLTIGALTYATYMLVLKSLVTGDASVIVVVILGEALTTRKLLGMLLCLAAIAVFFLGSRREESLPGSAPPVRGPLQEASREQCRLRHALVSLPEGKDERDESRRHRHGGDQ